VRQTGMSPCLNGIDIGRARRLPSAWFERSQSTTAHGSPGPTAQRGRPCATVGGTHRAHVGRAHTRRPSAWRMEDEEAQRQTARTRHASESCRRTAAPSEETRPQTAMRSSQQHSSLVWTASYMLDSPRAHRYSPRWGLGRFKTVDSWPTLPSTVAFASVKSVCLRQFLRRFFSKENAATSLLLPIVHSCHQLTTLLTGPVKHAVRPWACHYPSLAALVVLRASCAPAESHAPIILRRRHPQHPIRLIMHACKAQETCAAERADATPRLQ